MISYVQVSEDVNEEPIELPTEDDDTLLLTTLTAQFPGACGLRYKNVESNSFRGVRMIDGRFHAPDEGWDDRVFFCVYPKENKRKSDDILENSTAKTKRMETKFRCTDLIVLGLPWKTTADTLHEYFESYGEVLMATIKEDPQTGKSRGFGFIRFATYESQVRVISQRHMIDGRWCVVRIPNSKEGATPPSKVFVGRITNDITSQDLRDYFGKFGEVVDVFLPHPCRGFGFVTFEDPYVAQSLCGEDHIVKKTSVRVSAASARTNPNAQTRQATNDPSSGYRNYSSGPGTNGVGPGDVARSGGPGPSRDMPNLQALGITAPPPQTQPNPLSNLANLSALAPALLAAALNQAGSLLNNLQQGAGVQSNSGQSGGLSQLGLPGHQSTSQPPPSYSSPPPPHSGPYGNSGPIKSEMRHRSSQNSLNSRLEPLLRY